MIEVSFRYPGNSYHQFTQLLGMIADGSGNRVVVKPEQWSHSKLYGTVRFTKLQHYLELTLYKPDGSIAFSYRDFCFGVQEKWLSNDQQECAQIIRNHAKRVAARIQTLFPSAKIIEVDES